MAKILISPSKYLQGAGEMKKIGTYASNCGKKSTGSDQQRRL